MSSGRVQLKQTCWFTECRSFVEMCIVSCLSASSACVCGRGAGTWGCLPRRSPCCRYSPPPFYSTSCGWLSFGWLKCRQRTASTQSRCGGGVAAHPRLPGARFDLPSPVPACTGAATMPQPSTLRLIWNATALPLAAASPTLLFNDLDLVGLRSIQMCVCVS